MRTERTRVRALLDEAAKTPREEVLYDAAEALAAAADSTAVLDDLILELTGHPGSVQRALAARALGYVSSGVSQRAFALQQALKDGCPEVREMAANALTELGDKSALPALYRALDAEKVDGVVCALRDAIDELEGRPC